MRRSASGIINELENRVARLEKTALISRVEADLLKYSKNIDDIMDAGYYDDTEEGIDYWGSHEAKNLAIIYKRSVYEHHKGTTSLRGFTEPRGTAPHQTLQKLAALILSRGYSKALKDLYVNKALKQIKKLGI